MIVAQITVTGAKATVTKKDIITAGMVGAKVHIDYADPLWEGLRKTVVFDGVVCKDDITGNQDVTIRRECIAKPIHIFRVGVYGVDAEKNIVIPTLWANIGPVLDAADPSGDTSIDPSLPVWAQALAKVGEAADRAEQAEQSAQQAATTATEAATSAKQSAADASGAAETATAEKNEAAQFATNAGKSADSALLAADTAKKSASNAANSAAAALASQNAAAGSANAAGNSAKSALDAASSAGLAKTAAEAAKDGAVTAKDNAVSAKKDAESAKTAALDAKRAAEEAKQRSEAAMARAETAQESAETARARSETAKTNAEAAKIAAETSAQNASTSESSAQNHATQAASDAERAAASAQKAEDALATQNARLDALEARPVIDPSVQWRLDNLEAAAQGYLYREAVDAAEAYEKTVPTDAMKWAVLDKVGGKTLVWNLTKPEGIKEMKRISDAGLAREFYNVGKQIHVIYEDSNGNTYDMPWDIVHIGDAKLADGTIKKDAIYLQSHYATVEGVQWDKEEKEVATEETAQDGLFYYVPNGEGFKLLDIAVGATIPYADYENKVYHNAIKDTTGNICRYGYNRESHAALPQWLNSIADKGAWWTAKHVGDVAPNQLNSVRGFLAGLPADFVSCMEELTITQALNTVSEPDKTLGKESYTAKVFLPHLEQMYVKTQISGVEGEAWDYYKQLAQGAGLTGVFQWHPTTYDVLKSYALDNHSSAQYVRLASANRGGSCSTWYVHSSGYVGGNGAGYAYRCRPACVI